MKRILGLDLGVGSIGWSLIQADEEGNPLSILDIGCRIVPLSPDDTNEFSSGNAISKNRKRTQKRTIRKGYDRYQQRRQNLTNELRGLGMLPDERLIKLPVLDLWQLRAYAATPGKRLTLPEIGRVLYHINQKRGYLHSRTDEDDRTQRDYVQAINNRFANIKAEGITIGQYFARKLSDSEVTTDKGKFYTFRIKEQVFPRKAYQEEFDQIIACQRIHYPDILTDEVIHRLRDEIIFYQRPFKSCKYLISQCEFAMREYKTADGKIIQAGPKVAPRSSPLFQVCKIWESVNNITLKNRNGESYPFSAEERLKLFNFFDNNEKLTVTDLKKILGLSTKDKWWGGKAIGKGLQGNTTKMALKKALQGREELLSFHLQNINSRQIDTETGEILQEISPEFEKEPLYRLWHIVYSMKDPAEMASALKRQFGINDPEVLSRLSKIDFIKAGYGNKSARFIRQILPYLQKGLKYSEACDYISINHSNSLTTAENNSRELRPRMQQLQKNELRQPIIEKILNQMVNIVNALLDKYASIDEVRVELARELKQSRDERNSAFLNNSKRERENKVISERIQEMGIRSSRNRIQKYRLWEESKHICFYCGQPVGVKEFLEGTDVEIEHIIPRSLFFDDSFSNKVCACRKCNAEKGNRTAYDYMKQKGENDFADYTRRIEDAYEKKDISKTKRERLLTTAKDIPEDFIDRQLRQSQYISKKAVEMLKQVCRNVWTTSGSVTDFVRHQWGYDNILHDLNLKRYKDAGQTEIIVSDHLGQLRQEERIKDWTKRLDHRHHAIDALTIASTKQSYIQRLNNLNASRDQMFQELEAQSKDVREKYSLLENWMKERPHIPVSVVSQAVEGILVSFKTGKRVTTPGKRYIYKNGKREVAQNGISIPRGPLSEESVYGVISCLEENVPVKKLFEHPDIIFKPFIREKVKNRIKEFDGDWKAALKSIKKTPIFLGDGETTTLEYATCWKKEYVIRYPLANIQKKDIKYIVDQHIQQLVSERINAIGEKDAFKETLFSDKAGKNPIKSVRLFTGLTQNSLSPVKYLNGYPIGYSKPGNNHHFCYYRNKNGELFEHIVSFWHAVDRKKYGIPVIVEDTDLLWEEIVNRDLPQDFLKSLPPAGLKLEVSLQQNEMFILGMSDEEYQIAIKENDLRKLNNYLYRVQKISSQYNVFRRNTDTGKDEDSIAQSIGQFIRISSIRGWIHCNPHKVRVNILGKISEI